MADRSALMRFYAHAELMSLTLGHLDGSDLVRLSPTLLPHVAAIIYCRVDYARYLDTLQLTSRWRQTYLNAIRILDAHEIDIDGDTSIESQMISSKSRSLFTPTAIAELLEHCPNITSVYRNEGWHRAERWIVHPTGRATGRVYHMVRRSVPRDLVTEAAPRLDPPEDWSGWESAYGIELHLDKYTFGRWEGDVLRQILVKDWLMDFDNLDSNICRLYNDVPVDMTLTELGELSASRKLRGKREVEAIHWWYLPPFTIPELAAFGQLAVGLQELTLLNRLRATPKLTVMDLAEIIKVVKRDLPCLERLSIGLNGCWDGKWDYIFDEDIPISDLPWDGTMKEVEVVLQDDAFDERPGNIPLFAIARNLACLGGPACRYSIHVDESGQTRPAFMDEKQLERIVRWFKKLPAKRLAKMRTAQLMRFGVVNPDVASLEALAFTVDGDPIHPDIYGNILRLREDMKVGLERGMHGMKGLERMSRFGLDSAQAVMADARHHLRMRKMELQQDMQELADQGESSERSALGGSLLDPEFHREAEVDRSQWALFTFDEDVRTELKEWREFRKLKSLQFEIGDLEEKRDTLLEEVKQAEGRRESVSETA